MSAESPAPPSITPQQLRDKALLALEDAVQETRWRRPRQSEAVRFALAWLWASGGAPRDPAPFVDFWRALHAEPSLWSFGSADHALSAIYLALGLERPDAVGFAMWRRWAAEMGDARARSGARPARKPGTWRLDGSVRETGDVFF